MNRLGLFEGIGIEIEYMIVDAETLAVKPIADDLLVAQAGQLVTELEVGEIAWSNELVLHVIELKTNGPADSVDGDLLAAFERDVRRMDELLEPMGSRLLPTAMHPLMDPMTETVLWPHGYNVVYRAYDRIFDCRGHGWSNLQSLHLNFPFGDEDDPRSEFGHLHAGIRLLLPILPALCASSPMVEGRFTGTLDNRMSYYRTNSARVPSLTGLVVPEAVFDLDDYREQIFEPMDREIGPLDPDGVLVGEPFLNARGAIARFDRGAIEIRVIDVQETPRADLAVAVLVEATLKLLASGHWSSLRRQQAWPAEPLAEILLRTIQHADLANIEDADYLALFGLDRASMPAGELWSHLLDEASSAGWVREPWRSTLREMIDLGTLSRRIGRALGQTPGEDADAAPDRDAILDVYRRLADCLRSGRLFRA